MILKKLALSAMSVLLAGALLTGCGGSTAETTPGNNVTLEAETETSATETSSETTTEAVATETSAEATEDTTINADDQSLQKIIDKGQLVIGTSADYPPYEFHKLVDGKDEILGLDIQLANEIAQELGVQVKIVDMNYDGLLMALQSGQVDMVMAAMTPKEERKKAVDFSDIYFNADQTMLVRAADADKYNTVESLVGKKIGVQKGSLQEGIAKEQFPESRAVSLTKIPNLVMELENNKVEGVIMETAVADGYLEQYPSLAQSTVPIEDVTGGSAIAMPKGSTALVAKVNEIIARVQSEGKIDEFMRIAVEQNTAEE